MRSWGNARPGLFSHKLPKFTHGAAVLVQFDHDVRAVKKRSA
jgi:hypothetical protein